MNANNYARVKILSQTEAQFLGFTHDAFRWYPGDTLPLGSEFYLRYGTHPGQKRHPKVGEKLVIRWYRREPWVLLPKETVR